MRHKMQPWTFQILFSQVCRSTASRCNKHLLLLGVSLHEFVDNKANEYGGAILLMTYSRMRISSSVFSNNAAIYGGTIHLKTGVSLQLTDCRFIGKYFGEP